jgi:peptidoglycan hydrolase-like protein with peptidoglycan-binding domain
LFSSNDFDRRRFRRGKGVSKHSADADIVTVSIINDRSMPMNKLVFATVIALPLAASFPALAQQGSAAPQPAQPGASQGVAAITLNEDQVRQLQQALNDNGFDAGEVDGVFGARTRAALSRFQSKAGLQPTGQMDQQTLALVGLSGQAQQPAAAPATPDQSTGRSNQGDQQGSPGPRQ